MNEYYRNKNEKGKIDKNLVNANIKLVDENKYLKEQIQKAIDTIEQNENKAPMEVILNDIGEALKILKGLVE